MVGGAVTYEIALEDCRVEGWKLLGTEGQGFASMQLRLGTRRLEMAAWSSGEREEVAAVARLARMATGDTGHVDPLCREAAVAAG